MKCKYADCQEGHYCIGYHEETDEYEWSACPCCGGSDYENCPTCTKLEEEHDLELLKEMRKELSKEDFEKEYLCDWEEERDRQSEIRNARNVY